MMALRISMCVAALVLAFAVVVLITGNNAVPALMGLAEVLK